MKVTHLLHVLYSYISAPHPIRNHVLAVLVFVNGRWSSYPPLYEWTSCPLLYEASHQGHLDVVKLLVTEGADVDHEDKAGWSPLYLAAYYGHLEIVKYLAVQVADFPLSYIYLMIY